MVWACDKLNLDVYDELVLITRHFLALEADDVFYPVMLQAMVPRTGCVTQEVGLLLQTFYFKQAHWRPTDASKVLAQCRVLYVYSRSEMLAGDPTYGGGFEAGFASATSVEFREYVSALRDRILL